MTELLFNQIINPENIYYGNKNSIYLKNIFMPKFIELNKLNILLTKEQLKTLESKVCTGKLKSLLSDSIYNKLDILDVITKNNLLSEKFIIRIIDILLLYKEKHPHQNLIYNFSWIYNLKKNGCIINDELLKSLSDIGFKSTDIITEKYSSIDFDFMGKIFTYSIDITDLNNFLLQNPSFIPKNTHIKCYFDNFDTIYFNKSIIYYYIHIFNLYDLLLKHKYQLSSIDMDHIITSLHHYIDICSKSYLLDSEKSKTNLIYIEKIIELFNKNNVYYDQTQIYNFLKNTSRILYCDTCYYFHRTVLEYLLVFNILIKSHINNKNNILEKNNYMDYLIYKTNASQSTTSILFGKTYKSYITEILTLLKNENLLNITNNTLNRVLIKGDDIGLDYILENGFIIPDEKSMDIACFYGNIDAIKKFIDNKFIPTIKNIYCINNFSVDILNVLLDYGGLIVTDELIEYLINKNIKLNDLEKYGYNTLEKQELITELSIKHRNFPYQTEIQKDFQNIFSTIRNNKNFGIHDLEIYLPKFNNDLRLKSLLDLFVINNNLECIYFFKEKYPYIKPSNRVIHSSFYSKMYMDLFNIQE